MTDHDPVEHPAHYTSHPSGVECIEITEHLNFTIGNAVKYLWRAGLKDTDDVLQDLRKAKWYIEREISRIHREQDPTPVRDAGQAAQRATLALSKWMQTVTGTQPDPFTPPQVCTDLCCRNAS